MPQKHSTPLIALWGASILVVCWLSLTPNMPQPVDIKHIDLVEHLLAYTWLALLPMRAFRTRQAAIVAAGSMVFLGAGIEIAQHFVPGRFTSWADMAANTAGVVLGVWIGERIKEREYFRTLRQALGVKDR
ncbi:VanZ family protein [Desulfobaculum xiamenense]|uniref:VanZ family protein n=1 Tax=Desulfobaculum xiamenense TaxID=995050 RepID=A0A846QJX6_9BACT|nr:VanZ family protein [Desulfobaculum xiamenense]NJB67417.1 VanZ family protein [Desulfobaculum xiamenense]